MDVNHVFLTPHKDWNASILYTWVLRVVLIKQSIIMCHVQWYKHGICVLNKHVMSLVLSCVIQPNHQFTPLSNFVSNIPNLSSCHNVLKNFYSDNICKEWQLSFPDMRILGFRENRQKEWINMYVLDLIWHFKSLQHSLTLHWDLWLGEHWWISVS